MKGYLDSIDKQIEFNKGKNIFNPDFDSILKFNDNTLKYITNINGLSARSEEILIEYTTDKALEEFCRINQYFSFDSNARSGLHRIYNDLFYSIKTHKQQIDKISKRHYQNLKQWLQKTNPFAELIYPKAGNRLQPVACFNYSAETQLSVLHLDVGLLMQPVIDIGCGKGGDLVKFLKNHGIKSIGIDRFSFSDEDLLNSDWLEFNYGIEKWGTITSHLGFSNHFLHHNLRNDGNYLEYAKKYMEILRSLKVGGKFHYAPDLPFIELYLDHRQYEIEKHEIGGFDFKATIVKRLK